MKLKTIITKFFLSYEGVVSPATTKWYTHYLRPLETLGDIPVTEITVDDLRLLYVELVHKRSADTESQNGKRKLGKDGYSTYTLHCFARCWRRLFNWCVTETYLQTSPAIRLALPPLPDLDPKAISQSDYLKLLAEAKKSMSPLRDEALVRFLADTNARVGGVAGLTLNRLDLKNREARVFEKGRGGNHKSRFVYFTPRTAQALAEWLAVRPNTSDERVFLLKEAGIYQVMDRLGQKAGADGPYNPHAFRHAFALGMLAKGANLGQVSQLMGHSSITVTDKSYGRFGDKYLKEFHERYTWVADVNDIEDVREGGDDVADLAGAKWDISHWITIPQALALAKEQGILISRNSVIHAAGQGNIYGASKQGRDWLMPRSEFLAWVSYRHRPKVLNNNSCGS